MIIEDESFGIIPLKQEGGHWKVLIILHKSGHHWGFPKGHSNPDETPQEAAERELKEETGLHIVSLLLEKPLIETYNFRIKQKMVRKRVLFFPALVEGQLQLQEEEIREAKWLSFQEAADELSFKEAKLLLKEMCALLQIPYVF